MASGRGKIELIPVEVAFATPARQVVVALRVNRSATVGEAINQSGILREFPQLDLSTHAVGIFGEQVRLDATLAPGDRVEIYRPLLADPKQVRRQRVRRGRQ